jgi:hypothetical protein
MPLRHSLIAVLLLVSSRPVMAGAYFGVETASNDTTLNFLGAQTEQPLFFGIFLGSLRYEFDDGNAPVEVKSTFITPTVGYQFRGPVTYSIALGATWNEEEEARNTRTDTTDESGAVVQFGAAHYGATESIELLASYSDPTEFVWSRLRAKRRVAYIHDEIFFGGEVFWMGNDDFDSYGGGALLEARGDVLSVLLKAGASDSGDTGSGVYGGVEFGLSF